MSLQNEIPLMKQVASGSGEPEDNIELVRTFEKPVLLVKGERSNPYLHDILDVLAEEFPYAQVATFPGGHAPHIESMQPFLKRFTRFLSERKPAQ
jgi:pimeloyl-ACP methyl ester carboxylesterase